MKSHKSTKYESLLPFNISHIQLGEEKQFSLMHKFTNRWRTVSNTCLVSIYNPTDVLKGALIGQYKHNIS